MFGQKQFFIHKVIKFDQFSICFCFIPIKISWASIWGIIHLWEDFIPTIIYTTVCWLLVISKIHFKKPCSMKRENNFLRLTWFYIMKTSTTPNSDVYLFWYKVFSSSSSISAVANKTKLCGHRSLKIGQQQKIRGKLKLKTVLRIFCRLFSSQVKKKSVERLLWPSPKWSTNPIAQP